MSDFTTKTEVQEKDRRLRDETGEARDSAREHTEDATTAAEALDGADNPFFRETADRLNEIKDRLTQEVQARASDEQENVESRVKNEQAEVSEPMREGENRERGSAERVEAAGQDAGEYLEVTREARDEHLDAAEFAREVADDSERHQEESHKDAEEITQVAKAAVEKLKKF